MTLLGARCLAAFLAIGIFGDVYAEPKRITVPTHLEYCATSRPLTKASYELPEVREALLSLLNEKIEEAAIRAGLKSIGVTFVDSISMGPRAAIAPASGVGSQSADTYVVRGCAVIPAKGDPTLPADGLREVPSRVVFAELCTPSTIDVCRKELELAARQVAEPSLAAGRIVWRTRTALTNDDTPANLVASMSDSSLRTLRDGAPRSRGVFDVFIVAAELERN